MDDDLLVFDLRNGRVGGLTFCTIVERWFSPEQCFEIDNDPRAAAARWAAFPLDRRNGMRFVWGHSFSAFQKLVALDRPYKLVGLIRHPLLKISGVPLKTAEDLPTLEKRSVFQEFQDYARDGGALPTSSVQDFLDAHFMMGVTEFMEESLFLLRAKLKLEAPIENWRRIGSDADQNDNIYSHGFLKDFVESQHYAREIGYYNNVCDKLFNEFANSKIYKTLEYKACKANCRGQDATLSKWISTYPNIFSYASNKAGERVAYKKRGAASWSDRLRSGRGLSAAGTRILPGRDFWTVIVGDDAAEQEFGVAEGDAGLGQIRSSQFTIHIRFSRTWRARPDMIKPNMIRIDLDIPAMEYGSQSVYCAVMRHALFDTELGSKSDVRRFDIPISPSVNDITFVFRRFGRARPSGASFFAQVRKLAVVHIPLDGQPRRGERP